MKIISQETIKPSSPTPPHLKTHYLTLVDIYNFPLLVQFVFFYNDGDINILKKSLSQCLTQYYPFAGRILSPSARHIDCNDQGVEFFEASHDSRLDDFIRKEANHESLRELVPNVSITSLAAAQLNHFTGAGVAVGVSISHKVADAFAIATFIDQWAKVTRGESPFKPNFLTSTSLNNTVVELPEVVSKSPHEVRSFVFPNSKLNELKNKVMSSMGIAPTRVELLTSLIFKCAVDAATTKSGSFQPLGLSHTVNMRNKIMKNDPEKAVGNIVSVVTEKVVDPHESALNEVVAKLKKAKKETEEVRDLQGIVGSFEKILAGDRSLDIFWTSSLCWFPFYEVDFGWGMPVRVNYVMPKVENRNLVLMDTPCKDGIEVYVSLPVEEMIIFEQDKELLAYIEA